MPKDDKLEYIIGDYYTPGERQFLLYRFLLENTCAGHVAKRQAIYDYLFQYGIQIERKTLYTDLDVLRGTMGIEVEFDQHLQGYWVKNPQFEPYELRLIVDSIQSSRFITQAKANELTQKIKGLTDRYTASTLNRPSFVVERVHSKNESVVKDADRIYQAIENDFKISFRYFHRTPDRSNPEKFSKGGDKYIVSPYALFWENGNYYLYAYVSEKGKFMTFRVDRMDQISRPLPTAREGKDLYRETEMTRRKAKVFGAYRGKEYLVKLRCSNRMADAIFDQFGKDVMLMPADDGHFTVNVLVETSPPFFAWLSTFGKSVKILHPQPVVEDMKKFIGKLSEMYADE